jgi:hypothetical protein
VKLVSEHLDQARQFERLAAAEEKPEVKKRPLDQAQAYYKLAKMRAMNLGLPMPEVPPQKSDANR